MQFHNPFQWVLVDVWVLEQDITIKRPKLEQCSVLEAGLYSFMYLLDKCINFLSYQSRKKLNM